MKLTDIWWFIDQIFLLAIANVALAVVSSVFYLLIFSQGQFINIIPRQKIVLYGIFFIDQNLAYFRCKAEKESNGVDKEVEVPSMLIFLIMNWLFYSPDVL